MKIHQSTQICLRRGILHSTTSLHSSSRPKTSQLPGHEEHSYYSWFLLRISGHLCIRSWPWFQDSCLGPPYRIWNHLRYCGWWQFPSQVANLYWKAPNTKKDVLCSATCLALQFSHTWTPPRRWICSAMTHILLFPQELSRNRRSRCIRRFCIGSLFPWDSPRLTTHQNSRYFYPYASEVPCPSSKNESLSKWVATWVVFDQILDPMLKVGKFLNRHRLVILFSANVECDLKLS